uniref:Pentatricopeptide repeat-containing protein n=1 Tax=Tanacetum cinerariifolium TaxID=118510 RepID=A0A6L2NXC9_TANCI|nr:hypothetical protein [Tanacetum cinerariifolium]
MLSRGTFLFTPIQSFPHTLKLATFATSVSLHLLDEYDNPKNRSVSFSGRIHANDQTYCWLLEGFLKSGSFTDVKKVHGKILKSGFENFDAIRMLDGMPDRDLSFWNGVFFGLIGKKMMSGVVFGLFGRMLEGAVAPDEVTFLNVIRACSGDKVEYCSVKMIHGKIVWCGFGTNYVVCNPLIDLYAKKGDVDRARYVFRGLGMRDNVSWVAMISGFSQNGCEEESILLFTEMHNSGIIPTPYVFFSVISSCTKIVFFDKGLCEKALELYEKMQLDAVKPDSVTVASLLSACTSVGDLFKERQLHSYATKARMCANIIIEGSLLDLYERDVVSWTAMIAGYAQHDLFVKALKTFEKMIYQGIQSDNIGFSSAISACADVSTKCVSGQRGLVYLLYVIKSPQSSVSISRSIVACGSIMDIRSVLTQRALTIFCETYHIPDEVHPQLLNPNQTIHEMPSGKIGVYARKGVPKDPFPKSYKFNAEHFATLVVLSALFHKYPEPFLCLVGISRYYTLDEDAYPEFLGDNDEGMDLLAFIRTADPTKVRVTERQRAEDEPRLLESTNGRVVPLPPIAPALAVTTDTIVEDVALLQPRRQRKRKTVVANVGGPSHLPKKLREDYGALGGASTAGKSMSAVRSLFTEAVLDAGAKGEPIPTMPFVTSSVSATPASEDKSPADSVPGLNLRTIGAPQRFVISSDSFHHSGANIAEAEVDSIVRSSGPAIATVTTVTAAIDADATATRAPVAPSLFGVGSSSTSRIDSVPGGFSNVSGSDFLIGSIRTVVDPDSDLQKVYAELLKAKDGEIKSLKAQLLLKEAKATEAIRLRVKREKNELGVKVTDLSASIKVREEEVVDLDAQVTAVKLHNDNLVGHVHEPEISSAGLQEKFAAYEGFVSQLEKFQEDEKLEEVNEKFDKLCADFVDMALHLEEKFYPHLLTTISGRRWLLTYGMELAVAKCLNSTEYLSALGAAISKAVEKGMQEGLSVGITHGAEAEVPIHHSPDQRVVGASALSLSLEVSHSRVKKMRENIANHVSALRGVFVPLSEPLSATALEGMEGSHDAAATLSTTFVSASTIPPFSTDDYEVAHADGQGGASVDDETAAVDDMNLFVSNVELNISE